MPLSDEMCACLAKPSHNELRYTHRRFWTSHRCVGNGRCVGARCATVILLLEAGGKSRGSTRLAASRRPGPCQIDNMNSGNALSVLCVFTGMTTRPVLLDSPLHVCGSFESHRMRDIP